MCGNQGYLMLISGEEEIILGMSVNAQFWAHLDKGDGETW